MAIKYTEEQLNNVDKSFLVQMFLNQQEEMAKATNQVELLTNEVQSLNKKMQTLMEQLVLSKKARFGQSSEKMEDAAQISFMEVNGTIVSSMKLRLYVIYQLTNQKILSLNHEERKLQAKRTLICQVFQ